MASYALDAIASTTRKIVNMKPVSKAVHQQAKRRAKEKAWQELRWTVLERDRYICRACSLWSDTVDVHHIKPRSLGGKNTTSNCLALCRLCHQFIHLHSLVIHGDSADGQLQFERVKP